MAAPIKPQKVTANGKDSWWYVPAIDDIKAPTATEINAASGLNISCFLLAEQEGVTANTERASLARLLCETSTQEALGATTWSLADITGVFDPQAAVGDNGKKAWEALKAGGAGFLVRRQGVISETDADVTAGQFVDVFRVETAPATPGKTATDASGVYSFTAAVGLLGQAFNVAVVAGA